MTKLIRYDNLDLIVTARLQYIDVFHVFGYEITEIKHNDVIIPLSSFSEDTLEYLETEVIK